MSILVVLQCVIFVASAKLYLGSWEGRTFEFNKNNGRCYAQVIETEQQNYFYLLMFDGQWESDPYELFEANGVKVESNSVKFTYLSIDTNNLAYRNISASGEFFINNNEITGKIYTEKDINLLIDARVYTESAYYFDEYVYVALYSALKLLELFGLKKILSACNIMNIAVSVNEYSIILSTALDVFYFMWAIELTSKSIISFIHYGILSLLSLLMIHEKSKIYTKVVGFSRNVRRRSRFSAFIVLSMIYIATMNSLYYPNVILSNMVFVPHIIKTLKILSLPKNYILCLIVVQLTLTLYITMYSGNFLIWEPDYLLSTIVICVVGIQVVALYYSQAVRNSLGVALIRRSEENQQTVARIIQQTTDCAICLCPLGSVDIIATHCEHAFHQICLQRWIFIRAICPICRERLDDLVRHA